MSNLELRMNNVKMFYYWLPITDHLLFITYSSLFFEHPSSLLITHIFIFQKREK